MMEPPESYLYLIFDFKDNSELIAQTEILFTVSIIDALRKHKYFEDSVKLFHPEKNNKENGFIIYKISIQFLTLDTKIYEDNKEIEECFYDPFEKDPNVIKEVKVF